MRCGRIQPLYLGNLALEFQLGIVLGQGHSPRLVAHADEARLQLQTLEVLFRRLLVSVHGLARRFQGLGALEIVLCDLFFNVQLLLVERDVFLGLRLVLFLLLPDRNAPAQIRLMGGRQLDLSFFQIGIELDLGLLGVVEFAGLGDLCLVGLNLGLDRGRKFCIGRLLFLGAVAARLAQRLDLSLMPLMRVCSSSASLESPRPSSRRRCCCVCSLPSVLFRSSTASFSL